MSGGAPQLKEGVHLTQEQGNSSLVANSWREPGLWQILQLEEGMHLNRNRENGEEGIKLNSWREHGKFLRAGAVG